MSNNSNQPAPSNSIDTLTIAYLKGEITFQQYETQIENLHLQNEYTIARTSADSSQFEIINTIELGEMSNSNETNRVFSALMPYQLSRAPSTSSSRSTSPTKKPKTKSLTDRFLSLKSIIGDDEMFEDNEEDEDDEDELSSGTSDEQKERSINKEKAKKKSQSEMDVDLIDQLDDASNWTDFDIETLNFDKFIKDHQTRLAESPSLAKNSKSNELSGNKRKRDDKDKEATDPAELKTKRRRNRVLPIEIQGLMGEANLAYARGETNRAIDVCLEVIKYAPKASEPYQLLSLLYSEMGQNDKALRVGLIAAQLNKDPDEWIQLIQQAVIEGDVDLVLFCYNNAIQCNPKNIQLHIERVRLLNERKDAKRLFLAKFMLLKYVDVNTQLDVYNDYFSQVMSELNDESDKQKKIYVLKNDMKKFQDKFALDSESILFCFSWVNGYF